MLSEPPISQKVALVSRVLTAIHFDQETSIAANEVDDIGADGFLSNELEPANGARTQAIPQLALSVGRLLAKPPGAAGFDQIGATHCCTLPSPGSLTRSDLSPQAGRGEPAAPTCHMRSPGNTRVLVL